MASTRAGRRENQEESGQQLEQPTDELLIMEIEDLPEGTDENENLPLNVNENAQFQHQLQNQMLSENQNSTQTNAQMSAQDWAKENIATWVQREFKKATEGTTDTEREQKASILLGDRSMLPDHNMFLKMSDTSDNVRMICGLTRVLSPHQTDNNQKVIAFFEKRRAEVPSTQWVMPQQVMDPIIARVPPLQSITEAR